MVGLNIRHERRPCIPCLVLRGDGPVIGVIQMTFEGIDLKMLTDENRLYDIIGEHLPCQSGG